MLKIRLKRTGKKHQPHYRIIVTPARSRRDGKAIAEIGSWYPASRQGGPKEEKLILNKNVYKEWVNNGAIPTEIVRKLHGKTS